MDWMLVAWMEIAMSMSCQMAGTYLLNVLSFVVASLLLSASVLAQEPSASRPCPANEQALRKVAHDFWAAYNHRDAAALDKLLDDRLLFVGESGNVLSKAQFMAPFRVPEGSMKSESAEQMENVRTLFADNTAFIRVEILPGKFDAFFTPGFPILERFVRNRSGRVVGIVYTLGYSEVEAKRVR